MILLSRLLLIFLVSGLAYFSYVRQRKEGAHDSERNAFFSDGLEEINEEVERQDGMKVEKWDNVKGCVNV